MKAMMRFEVKTPRIPIPFHKLLKIVAIVDGEDAEIRPLLERLKAEKFEVEVSDRYLRDVSEDAAVGAYIVALDGERMTPATVLARLNKLGGKHGIGRLDMVENRYVGMKSRGCYETPGGTIMLKAHRAMESITLDREVLAVKDDLMPRYARLVYSGYWFSPERSLLQTLMDESQQSVNGTVRLKLYKGTVMTVGRESKTDSLFDPAIVTFEEDYGAYNQADAGGFIKLNALRMRIAANLKRRKR